jgi:ParB family transcriptional regulator, chromosome partitioning protein
MEITMTDGSVDAGQSPRTRRRLGRGLSSLMSQPVRVQPPEPDDSQAPAGPQPGAEIGSEQPPPSGGEIQPERQSEPSVAKAVAEDQPPLRFVEVDRIQPNRYQPRRTIDPQRLNSLAASIRAAGVMQPVLLRPNQSGDGFEIVAGERRWRAATIAGLQRIPAIVSDLPDAQAAEWAVVENLQREDLDPIERAEAFRALVDQFGLTQGQVAERVGLDRSSVANTLRLNNLDEATKTDIRSGRLTQGHAKALLSVEDSGERRRLAETAMRDGWSVRQLERRVESRDHDGARSSGDRRSGAAKAEHILRLEEEVSTYCGLPARIHQRASKTSGEVILTFRTLDEFERFLDRLRRRNPA